MSEPLRLCIVGNANSIHVQRWARGMAHEGWRVTIFGPFQLDDPAVRSVAWTSRTGGRLHQLLALPGQLFEQWRFFRHGKFDLIWIHGVDQGLRLAFLPRAMPLVTTVYGSDVVPVSGEPDAAPPNRLARMVLRRSVVVTAASRFLQDFSSRRFNLAESRTVVIPFGVDTSVFVPAVGSTIGPVPTVFYSKGSKSIYGLDVLLRAVALLKSGGQELIVRVAGSGDYSRYAEKVRELDIEGSVEFIGALGEPELHAVLSTSTVFAMPSLVREGFGVAAVEAMSCAVPVVASCVGAIPEVVEDGVSGILVQPGDPVALAGSISILFADMSRRDAMGAEGRKTARERYEWSRCVDAMSALLKRIVSGEMSS